MYGHPSARVTCPVGLLLSDAVEFPVLHNLVNTVWLWPRRMMKNRKKQNTSYTILEWSFKCLQTIIYNSNPAQFLWNHSRLCTIILQNSPWNVEVFTVTEVFHFHVLLILTLFTHEHFEIILSYDTFWKPLIQNNLIFSTLLCVTLCQLRKIGKTSTIAIRKRK